MWGQISDGSRTLTTRLLLLFPFSATSPLTSVSHVSVHHHCHQCFLHEMGHTSCTPLYDSVYILFYMMKNKTKGQKLSADCWWVCVDWLDVDISSTYSRGRSAPRWSHTGCRARCPESHAAPCRTHTVLLLNSVLNRNGSHQCVLADRVYLFLAVFCEGSVADSSSSSSEPESLSFLERFFSFSRTCRTQQASEMSFVRKTSPRRHIIALLFSRHPGAAPTFLK